MNTLTDNNTRRHPRTLQEAFGPYTSSQIQSPPEPMHRNDQIVVWASTAAAVAMLAVLFFFG